MVTFGMRFLLFFQTRWFQDVERDNRVAAHYLRLSAAIALGRHRLDAEVGDMATEPLPSAVIDAIPR